jgi:hypothetical protein
MAASKNTRLVAHIDCPGGGQVWVDGKTLYIGHMREPAGTTIVDVADPKSPVVLARVDLPPGWHSHKVRVANGIMVVNHERQGQDGDPSFGGGLGIYDVSTPARPQLLCKWRTHGKGVHRYDFDGRYAYISPTAEGYVGNIMMILDLKDPRRPEEVGRWWIPGQWQAGGEANPWADGPAPRCHHPMRMGDRLYVSYWHHGYHILDIADMRKPKLIASGNTSPAFPHPTHTCLPIPQALKGRKVMVVADEDVAKLWPAAPAFTWIYDITNERCPVPILTALRSRRSWAAISPRSASRAASSHSHGSRRACESWISPIRSRRARWRIMKPTRRRVLRSPLRTTSRSMTAVSAT